MSIKEIYPSLANDGEADKQAVKLLKQTHWFTINAVFDPRSGAALPQALSSFLEKIICPPEISDLHDRIWRITNHAKDSLRHLFLSLNENPSREQALMPIRNVHELDANSFIKLSNRPGRNIREKLAGKPYLQAVRHYQSVDLPENRLLKEFSIQIADLLEKKAEYLGIAVDPIVQIIHNWLHSNEAKTISRWNNTPPNNTLLSHRDYRRVWDAWRWLQSLDEDIQYDISHIEERQKTIDFWNDFANKYFSQGVFVADMPVLFNYDRFEITIFEDNLIQLWTDKPYSISPLKSSLKLFDSIQNTQYSPANFDTIKEPVCVDVSDFCAKYATKNSQGQFSVNFIWQKWKTTDLDIEIPLYKSKAIWRHSSATTIQYDELFFQNNYSREYTEKAAKSFSEKLHSYIENDELIWLIPDVSNDFELEVLRRNINYSFKKAEPLPRSVAAVIEKVKYKSIPKDGYVVIVCDTVGKIKTATKLIARYSEELLKENPTTKGYYWERYKSIPIDSPSNKQTNQCFRIHTLDSNGNWIIPVENGIQSYHEDTIETLLIDALGNCDKIINIDTSPVRGGIYLHQLQMLSQEVPLWRDYLPDLSMMIRKNGLYSKFILVENKTITPLRGKCIKINIPQEFTLPANQKCYEFPLTKGDGTEEFHYMAKLSSKMFPLSENTRCKLTMTYEYGADNPYTLSFEAIESSGFKSAIVEWVPANDKNDDPYILPSPELPPAKNWLNLQAMPGKDGNTFNIFDDFLNKVYFSKIIDKYNEACKIDASSFPSYKQELYFCWWNMLYDDKYYFWAKDSTGRMVYCSSDKIDDLEFNPRNFSRNQVFFANVNTFPPRETLKIVHVGHDKNNNIYCLAKNSEGKTIFCHSSNFIEKIKEVELSIGSLLYGNVKADKNNPDKFNANMITKQYGNDYAFAFQISSEKRSANEQEKITEFVKKEKLHKFREWYKQLASIRNLILGLRFDFLTIWNNGRSINVASNLPSEIKEKILNEIDAAFQIYNFLDIPKIRQFIKDLSSNDTICGKIPVNVDVIRARLLDFLSALNGNTPEKITEVLPTLLHDSQLFMYNNRAIAFALGNLELDWQKKLFTQLLCYETNDKKTESIILEVWAIILWRSLDIIDQIPYEKLVDILEKLLNTIKHELETLKKKPDDIYIPQRIGRHLDLLLALFRTRRAPEEKVRNLLLPLNKYSREFMNLLETIVNLKIPIVSYSVLLKLDKPNECHNLPDMIFALQLYLSGDDGAKSIQIVTNDDNE